MFFLLLADTDPSFLDAVRTHLAGACGVAVTYASSAEEALAVLKRQQFDAIISRDRVTVAELREIQQQCGSTAPIMLVSGGTETILQQIRFFSGCMEPVSDAAPDAMFVIDPDGTISSANRAGARLAGVGGQAALSGRSIIDFMHPGDREPFLKAFFEGLSYEFRSFPLEGPERWMEAIGAHTTVRGRSVVVVTVRDITRRKAAEQALLRRGEIFCSISLAAGRHLGTGECGSVMPDLLAHLGAAADVSRVYVMRRHSAKEGEPGISPLFAWAAPGIEPAGVGKRGWPAVFEDVLVSGRTVQGHTGTLGKQDQEYLVLQGIRSILLVPIMVEEAVWGLLGFDECRYEREWHSSEIGALETAACHIGAAIDRMQTVGDLVRSEERFRSIFEGSPIGVMLFDTEGASVDANPAAQAILGIPDRRGMPGYNLFRDPNLPAGYAKKLREGNGVSFQGRYCFDLISAGNFYQTRRSGSLDLDARMTPITGSSGRIQGYLVQLMDITTAKRAEEALRQSEEMNRVLVENLPDYIVVADLSGHILYVNPAAEQASGYTLEDLAGMPVLCFIPEYQQDFIEQRLWERHKGIPLSRPYEIEIITKQNVPITVLARGTPIRYRQREAVLIVLTDITWQKRLTRELEQSAAEMKHISEVMAQANNKLNLLSSVTRHDILNQLMVMRGYLAESMRIAEDPVLLGYLGKQEAAAEAIQAQIEFTRNYQDLGVRKPEWQDVAKILHRVDPEQRMLRTDVSELEIYADPMLGKVFYNLFDNAMRHGGHVTRVTVATRPSGSALTLVFEDNGDGISDPDREKIFTRGFGKNSGFGLFLCREILSITGISIEETGSFGRGARFEIHVPDGAFRYGPSRRQCLKEMV